MYMSLLGLSIHSGVHIVVLSLDFMSNGIDITTWIKMPITYPGDAAVDEYLKKLKKTGRSKLRIQLKQLCTLYHDGNI